MSRIISAIPNKDFTILIEFEHGNKILFNMDRIIRTMPYRRLNDPELFKSVKFDEKAIYWEELGNDKSRLIPLKLSLDNILFTLRDS